MRETRKACFILFVQEAGLKRFAVDFAARMV